MYNAVEITQTPCIYNQMKKHNSVYIQRKLNIFFGNEKNSVVANPIGNRSEKSRR